MAYYTIRDTHTCYNNKYNFWTLMHKNIHHRWYFKNDNVVCNSRLYIRDFEW